MIDDIINDMTDALNEGRFTESFADDCLADLRAWTGGDLGPTATALANLIQAILSDRAASLHRGGRSW